MIVEARTIYVYMEHLMLEENFAILLHLYRLYVFWTKNFRIVKVA